MPPEIPENEYGSNSVEEQRELEKLEEKQENEKQEEQPVLKENGFNHIEHETSQQKDVQEHEALTEQ